MKKYKVGYTQGTFDLFHVGHLNLLERASELCDVLVVGVNTDRLVKEYKNKDTVIKENERLRIVSSIRFVEKAILVDTLDKIHVHESINFDVIIIGDDWINNPRWIKTKQDLELIGVDTIFLPYTNGVSSSMIREKLK